MYSKGFVVMTVWLEGKAQRQLEKLYDEGEISPLAIIADSSSNGMVNAIYPSDWIMFSSGI